MDDDDDADLLLGAKKLAVAEEWWRDRYSWFESRGYSLRTRYHPQWTATWFDRADELTAEEAQKFWYADLMAGTRSDGQKVILKKVHLSVNPFEVDIAAAFGKGPLAEDPRNHCVPLLDVFYLQDGEEDLAILVMPMLRPFNSPRWDTVGEVVECWRQVFEGVHFMHQHHTAHRDCTKGNIMMDGTDMYPQSFHPIRPDKLPDHTGKAPYYTRTQRPPRYYLIDFGLSQTFDPIDGPPIEYPVKGGDRTAPECQPPDVPCDPFPTDVYYLGSWVLQHFLEDLHGLEFMRNLALDMTRPNPQERPTMDVVVPRLDAIIASLKSWTMRSRPTPRRELFPVTCVRMVPHLKRRIRFTLGRSPAIPRPSQRAAPANALQINPAPVTG